MNFPHPSLEEIIISLELLMLLWPARVLQRALEDAVRKEVRRIRKEHRKEHVSHARWCKEGECEKLIPGGQSLTLAPLEQAAFLAASARGHLPSQEQEQHPVEASL